MNVDFSLLISNDSIPNVNCDYILGNHFDSSYLLLTKKKVFAFISSLEIGNISKISKEKKSEENTHIEYLELSKKNIISKLREINKNTLKKKIIVGLDFNMTSVGSQKRLYSLIKESLPKKKIIFKDISEYLSEMRLIKREDEINLIKKSCSIGDKIFKETIDYIREKGWKNLTESDVVIFLKKKMLDNGSEESFPTIVASGKNASCPHHVPKDKKLERGFCIMDFGIKKDGYCSDMTRTIFLGVPTSDEISRYNLLLRTQKEILIMAVSDRSLLELNSKSRSLLGAYSELFIHSLGHGVGLEVHERPFFGLDKKLKKGMILAIEPGIYDSRKDSFGIRIEDMVMIDEKPLIITKSKKNMLILD